MRRQLEDRLYRGDGMLFPISFVACLSYLPIAIFALSAVVLPFWLKSFSGTVGPKNYHGNIHFADDTYCRGIPVRLTKGLKAGDVVEKERYSFTVEVNGKVIGCFYARLESCIMPFLLFGSILFFGLSYSLRKQRTAWRNSELSDKSQNQEQGSSAGAG